MRNQTVWLLVVLLGAFSVFLITPEGQLLPFERLVAQVGITVGVAPNPYNTLNDQLAQKQDQLNQEASDLAAQEEAMASTTAQAAPTPAIVWYLVAAIIVILLLVLLNFYFDWRRSHAKTEGVSAVPSDPEKPKE
jgi:predicted PurR-regulated permease PerM